MFMALVLGALVLVSSALAAQPIKQTTVTGPFSLDPGACDFPVVVTPTRKDQALLFTFSNGKFLGNFAYVATATNTASGKSVNINLSGSNTFTVNSDGSSTVTAVGGTLFTGEALLVMGRIVLSFDAAGNFLGRTITGEQTNLCTLLA